MDRSKILFGVDIVEWVSLTAARMTDTTDKHDWNAAWSSVYRDLGGNTTSGEKACPRSAAFGLWRLKALDNEYNDQDWTRDRVYRELGKKCVVRNRRYASASTFELERHHGIVGLRPKGNAANGKLASSE